MQLVAQHTFVIMGRALGLADLKRIMGIKHLGGHGGEDERLLRHSRLFPEYRFIFE